MSNSPSAPKTPPLPPLAGASLSLPARIARITFLGREALVQLETALGPVHHLATSPDAGFLADVGREIALAIPRDRLAVFTADGRRAEVAFP